MEYKRILQNTVASILAILMLVQVAGITAFADNGLNFTLACSKKEVRAGEEVTFTVKMNQAENVAAVNLEFNYNDTYLKYKNASFRSPFASWTAALCDEASEEDGLVTMILYTVEDGYSGSADIIDMTFQVLEGAKGNIAPIMSAGDVTDPNFNMLENTLTQTEVRAQEGGNDQIKGNVSIRGNAVLGQRLTASISGLDNPGTLSYQWYRDGIAIDGATSDTYTVVRLDIGLPLTVTVASSNYEGTLKSEPVIPKEASDETPDDNRPPFPDDNNQHRPIDPQPTPGTPISGGGSSSGGSNRNDSDHTPQAKSLFFREGEYDFWDSIQKQIEEAGNGNSITVDAKWFDRVPLNVLKALKNKDITLRIQWNGGADFTINGLDNLPIGGKTVSVPLGVLYEYAQEPTKIEKPDQIAIDSQTSVEDTSKVMPRTGPETVFSASNIANALPGFISLESGSRSPFKTASSTVPEQDRRVPALLPNAHKKIGYALEEDEVED